MKATNFKNRNERGNDIAGIISYSIETKDFIKMKTKKNIQREILISLMVITSLILFGITVQAQDFWRTLLADNHIDETEFVEINNWSESVLFNNYLTALLIEEESDEALKLEDWMTDENKFGTFFSLETEKENSLEVENWMTNENLFETNLKIVAEEFEETLSMEDWMIDENYFSGLTLKIDEEMDSELTIEGWMFNEDLFGNAVEKDHTLQLESWMISDEIW